MIRQNYFRPVNGSPYIHYDRKNFFKNLDPEYIENTVNNSRAALYAEQRNRYKERIESSGMDFDKYVDVAESFTEVFDELLSGDNRNEIIAKFQDNIMSINRKGLGLVVSGSKASREKQLKEITQDINKLQYVYDKMSNLIKDYQNIDKDVVDLYKGRGGSFNSNNGLYILTGTKQAETSYKNINEGLQQIEKYLGKMKNGTNLTKAEHEVARNIINSFVGQLNNIQGIGYEYIIGELLQEDNIKSMLIEKLKSSIKTDNVSFSNVDSVGEAFSKLETGALVRSTSDLTISIDMNGNDYSGEFQLGFSIKSAPKMSTKGGLKKKPVSYKSGRSWNEVGKALNLLNTEFEYYFANLVAKPTTRSYSSGRLKNGTKSYQALKRYIGSGYALDAIAGTGSGTDLVTHAIYLNKIMTITDLLDELENKGDLNVNIGSVAQDSEFVDGDPLLAKYIRSRNVLAKIRNLAMTFSK